MGILGILGPPYCGIGATIRIGREILCLPYAGFLDQNIAIEKSYPPNLKICVDFHTYLDICGDLDANVTTSWVKFLPLNKLSP